MGGTFGEPPLLAALVARVCKGRNSVKLFVAFSDPAFALVVARQKDSPEGVFR